MPASFSKSRNRQGQKRRFRRDPSRIRAALRFETLEDRLPLAFLVSNALNSGVGSLRQAIIDSNSTAGADLISFNIGGGGVQSIALTSALPIITDPVTIDGTTQPGFAGSPLIELNGSGVASGSGIVITAGNSTVKGLVVNRFAGGDGILLQTGGNNHVEGCYTGTDVTGTLAQGNRFAGIHVLSSADNVIGGTEAGKGNVASGNVTWGILINGSGAERNLVQGNRVGTNAVGTAIIPNNAGVTITDIAGHNTVGGSSAAARNIISGNLTSGVATSGTNLGGFGGGDVVIGNYIGTDVTGTVDLGNRSSGVFSGPNTRIGGTVPGEGNLISGNDSQGIRAGGTQIIIQGNYIGTDAAGNASVGNGQASNTSGEGVRMEGAPGALVSGNLISGNYAVGLFITSSDGIRVEGNRIGTNAAGTGDLGNRSHGVWFPSANTSATIGGTGPGTGNTIAYNDRDGVNVGHQSAVGAAILGNSIFANDGRGIDLALSSTGFSTGVTLNDQGDVDDGSNHLQNFPVLTAAVSAGNTTKITGTLNSKANTTYRLEFFANSVADATGYGEGQRYLGTMMVSTPLGSNDVSFPGVTLPAATTPGELLTATATDPLGNTSEFSHVLLVTAAPAVANPIVDLIVDEDAAPVLHHADLNQVFDDADDPDSALVYSITASDPSGIVTATINPDDTLDLSFLAHQHGVVQITVRATDPSGHFAEDTFQITVKPAADTPSATNAVTAEDTQTSTGLVLSRNAVDGAEVTYFQITGISGGTLFQSDGVTPISNNDFITFAQGAAGLKFTPNADLNTPAGDVFRFQVQASTSNSTAGLGGAVVTATITVTEVNDAPTGANDNLSSVDEDSGMRLISFASLLSNDLKGPANEVGQSLTIMAVDSASGGTVSLSGTDVAFTPTAGFSGAASFRYTLQDNGATSGSDDFRTSTAMVRFTITNVNHPPHISLTNTVTALPENTYTASRIKVADIVVTDDGDGINFVTLSGADAGLFQIDGNILYLNAGILLDFEIQTQLDVFVAVNDLAVGGNPDDAAELTIAIIDVDERPATVFVDDDWLNLATGVDPDEFGFASAIGIDAFATVQEGLDHVRNGGEVIVAQGLYAEHVQISREVQIQGAGADRTTLDGSGTGVVIDISDSADVNLLGVRIQGGNGSDGGGVHNRGTLEMIGVAVTNNAAQRGGGVFNSGVLAMNSSALWANRATGDGGGLYSGGTFTATNTTISGNTAQGGNGGGISSVGDATLLSVTVSDNLAQVGGGVARSDGAFRLHNSLIADNFLIGLQLPSLGTDVRGTFTSEGHNLIGNDGNDGGGFGSASTGLVDGILGDRVGSPSLPLHAGLLPLGDNGGATPTHALRFTSPARDGADSAAPSTDQRGQPRGQDGNNDGNAESDIGAYEAATPPQPEFIYVDDDWATLALGDDPEGPATQFGYDAFARIQPALDRVATFGVVNVAAGDYTEKLVVRRDVTLTGEGAAVTLLHGDTGGRALTVNSGTTSVVVSGVTIRDGLGGVLNEGTLWLRDAIVRDNFAQEGGGIANHGNLIVTESTIHHNLAFGNGGGILNDGMLSLTHVIADENHGHDGGGLANRGSVTLTDSTIHHNEADVNGGGIWNAGPLTVENSTISTNQGSSAGGGFYNVAPLEVAKVTHSTVANNRAGQGAGIYGNSGTFQIRSSIVAGNSTLAGEPALDLVGAGLVSGGHNLVSRNSSVLFLQPSVGDQFGNIDDPIDARLGPLADNGGSTLTHALLRGSPAIDHGDPAGALQFDQRGQLRIEDGDRDREKVIDVGAFEALSPIITIIPLTGRVKSIDGGPPPGELDFPNPQIYSAEILPGISDPLNGPVVFEARRAGIVITHQEIWLNSNGRLIVFYHNAQPGIDEISAWATLGEFHAFDQDVAFWNPVIASGEVKLQQLTGTRGYGPTLTTQAFEATLIGAGAPLAGNNVEFQVFRNDTDENWIADKTHTDSLGSATLSQTRSRPAVEELVATVTANGQQFFDNVSIKWVTAPPQLTLTTSRPDAATIRVVATLTRDLGPNLDDNLNPPVPSHPLTITINQGGHVSSLNDAVTNELGQYVFEIPELGVLPDIIQVGGELVTHLEDPNDSQHIVPFSAVAVVVDTVAATILPDFVYQELPTRYAPLGPATPFGVSTPNRAFIDAKVLVNGFPAPGVRVLFDIVPGPDARIPNPNHGVHLDAVTDEYGIAHTSFLNQNEFDFFDGDGDPGVDVVVAKLDGATASFGEATVRWFPSNVTGLTSFAAGLLTGTGFLTKTKPWVHVDMPEDPVLNPEKPAGPVKVRFIDPIAITGGVTSFREIQAADLPAAPNGFSAGEGTGARFYEIDSSVDTTLSIPRLLFIHEDDFPKGSQDIFHRNQDGTWEKLETFDGAIIAALDAATDFIFNLDVTLIGNIANLAKAAVNYATSELHHYRVAWTNSFSPFAIFVPTGAIPVGFADAYAVAPDGVLHVTAAHAVITNDTDEDSNSLSARLINEPKHGVLHWNNDGSFEYTPQPGYVGQDDFVYRPLDGLYEGDLTVVTIFVTPDPIGLSLGLESSTIEENGTATLTGSIAGPGTTGTHSVEIDWEGDGTFDQTMILAPGVTSFVASRSYLDDGPAPGNGTSSDDYAVTVRVGDNSGNDVQRSATIRVLNVAPTADAGTDQDVAEGNPVTLHGSFTDPGLLDDHTFGWQVTSSNGQVIADGMGTDFSFTPSDDGVYTVTFTVTDDDGGVGADTVVVNAHNAAPIASISGPASATAGQTIGFVLSALDAPMDQAARFTFEIDWDEDEIVDQTVVGLSGTIVSHSFADAGSHEVAVVATDKDDGTSELATHVVQIGSVSGGAGTVEQVGSDLVITGTSGYDTITIRRDRQPESIVVRINGTKYGPYSPTGQVIARGLAGNDRINVGEKVTLATLLDGGPGNDRLRGGAGNDTLLGGDGDDELIATRGDDVLEGGAGDDLLRAGTGNDVLRGGAGDDLLRGSQGDDLLDGGDGNDELHGGGGISLMLGGLGNDLLDGSSGRNVLIGGQGSDKLVGGSASDLLIAGTTAYDDNDAALHAILTEWTCSRSYTERVVNLRGGLGPILSPSGTRLKKGETVFDDTDVDELIGGAELDWLMYDVSRDHARDKKASEAVN